MIYTFGFLITLLSVGVITKPLSGQCSGFTCLECVGGGGCQYCLGSSDACIISTVECDHRTTTVVIPVNATEFCPADKTTTNQPPSPAPESSNFFYIFIGVGVLGTPVAFLISRLYVAIATRIRKTRQQRRPICGFPSGIAYHELETAIRERRVRMERHIVSHATPMTTVDGGDDGEDVNDDMEEREMPLFLPCPPKPPPSPVLALSEEDIQSLFLEMDRDRDGFIDLADLRSVLRSIGGDVDDLQLEWMIRDCDHVNGNVNFVAFRKKMLQIVSDQDLV